MISIKNYLDRVNGRDSERADLAEELSAALRQALRILLDGLPLESKEGREAAGHGVMAGLLRRFDEALTPLDVLEAAGEALTAVKQDNQSTRDYYRAQSEELQAMISMLAQTVASISVQKDSSVAQLQQIEKKIEQTSMLEDMRALKTNLAECLEVVREASLQQQKQSTDTIQHLERQIRSSKAHLANRRPAPRLDSEPIVNDETELQETAYAAVFLLDRADLISKRYGKNVLHEVLAFVRQHFKKMLMPKDRFIRWNGAAFIVLVERRGMIEDIMSEFRSVASLGRSQYFEVGDRSVLLDTSLTWTVFPQRDFAAPDLFYKAVDDFVSQAIAERQPAPRKETDALPRARRGAPVPSR